MSKDSPLTDTFFSSHQMINAEEAIKGYPKVKYVSVGKPATKYKWNSTIKVKAKKSKKKTKRIKLIPLPKLIRKADSVFSLWIRARDKKCVLCGSTTNLQNGHLIKRGKKILRWHEKNCNTLCSGCNYRDNFDHDRYVMWFINKYGVEEYSQFVMMEQVPFKPTRDFLYEIIKRYS